MEMEPQFDIAVLGAGPGGYVAAIRAAQMGAKVLVVEKDSLGGTCLNRGCIPTKAFLSDVKAYQKVKTSPVFSGREGLSVDLGKMVNRKNQVVETLTKGVGQLFQSHGVTLVRGKGTFVDPKTLEVTRDGKKEVFKAKQVILATGSKPASITNVTVDGKDILSSDEILNIQSLPRDLLVIGGGVIGVEFATIFHALGTKVTVVEMLPSIISMEDEHIIQGLKGLLERRGIQILTETKVLGAASVGGKVEVTVQDKTGKKEKRTAEKVLQAVGRIPSTEGLEKLKLQMEGRFVKVNERMETNIDGVYAIGDVIGKVMLAHAASAEGTAAVENILGETRRIDYHRVPSCIYTFPEVASVGYTEKQAKEKGFDIQTGVFPFQYNGKAITIGEAEGFIKIVAEKEYGEILGIHILGEHATDLIGEGITAMNLDGTIEDLGQVIKGHPTLSEAMMEAALDWSRMAIHLPKKK
jgi:dihydrolipoamide dehydrogenase